MKSVILASASPVRAHLLRAAGLDIVVEPARVDEEAVRESLHGAPARDVADALAELKARKVSLSHPGALVIGADQVLAFFGEIISKCPDMAAARALLKRLSGHEHELISAAVLGKEGGIIWRHCASVKMVMRPLSDAFVDSYLSAMGETVLESVGGYRFEGEGVQLFSHYAGDYFSILGLPLVPLLAALRDQGVLPE